MRRLSLGQQKRIRDWLQAKGHKREKVESLRTPTSDDLRAEMLALHGVSREQYRQLTGKG